MIISPRVGLRLSSVFSRMSSSVPGELQAKSVFTPCFNALTGGTQWRFMAEDYDYVQEIARCDYGDMLWDQERNQLYEKAIQKYVKRLLKLKSPDKRIKVLDIGAGTGLLSMMVCRAMGNELNRLDLNAYECFTPMAQCARKVAQTNGLSDKINLINMRSDEDKSEHTQGTDLLVTEVFDTELIGEGALKVFHWALSHQLASNPLVVPHKARIWVQLISSSWVNDAHQFREQIFNLNNQEVKISVPDEIKRCPGANHLYDVQANAFQIGKDISLVSEPIIAFTFDFTSLSSIKMCDDITLDFVLLKDCPIKNISIMFWWDLFMDDEGEYLLSCAPYWAHPSGCSRDNLPWRDHWMQAIYHFPANHPSTDISEGKVLKIKCSHDEYSFWFDLVTKNYDSTNTPSSCSCRIHQNLSLNRLLTINNNEQNSKYLEFIVQDMQSFVKKKILFLGDASLLPISLAKFLISSNHFYCLAKDPTSAKFFTSFSQTNEVADRFHLIDSLDDACQMHFDAVISEPFFNQTILPWDNLHFWFVLDKLREKGAVNELTSIYPRKICVKALPVSFAHLHKTKAKVKEVEGFIMRDFDELIEKARERSDCLIHSQPLWEYDGYSMSNEILNLFDWNPGCEKLFDSQSEVSKTLRLNIPKGMNNINLVFWMDMTLGEGVISKGPLKPVQLGHKVTWPIEKAQAVAFLCPEYEISDSLVELKFCLHYDQSSGTMNIEHFLERILS
ncbi:arginine methyltransferase 7 [Brevipalpus obovatus]|uniref:arginine methyltransferase 7 n=1 Tax=Brevipalpus obovatus TaxID=246614 RepID=UPI003D9E9C25